MHTVPHFFRAQAGNQTHMSLADWTQPCMKALRSAISIIPPLLVYVLVLRGPTSRAACAASVFCKKKKTPHFFNWVYSITDRHETFFLHSGQLPRFVLSGILFFCQNFFIVRNHFFSCTALKKDQIDCEPGPSARQVADTGFCVMAIKPLNSVSIFLLEIFLLCE